MRWSFTVVRTDPALVASLQDGMCCNQNSVFEDPDLLWVMLNLKNTISGCVGDGIEFAGDGNHAALVDSAFDS
jgi:hypothetical protein